MLSSLAQSEARKEMSIEVPVELSTQKEQVNAIGVFTTEALKSLTLKRLQVTAHFSQFCEVFGLF